MSKKENLDSPENKLVLELKSGTVTIQLRPDKAPKHVRRIKELAREGFYDGVKFHRVIEGFMAQTGDPSGTGMGGSGKSLKAEFNDLFHMRGTCSMARMSNINSADSQFFICYRTASSLDKQYTIWGTVLEGMEHVDAIAKGEPPAQPDVIISLKVAADIAA